MMDELVAFIVSTGPKHFKSSWTKFMLNLLAVVAQLKPSHLIDYVSPPWEVFGKYFKALKRHQATQSLALLKISDDVFIINTTFLQRKLEHDVQNSFSTLSFIDVNPSLHEPKVITHEAPLSKTDIEKISQFCDSPDDILHIIEINTPYLPTLFGYLLGYPTLYANSQFSSPSRQKDGEEGEREGEGRNSAASLSNCLSLQPLTLNKVVLHGFTPTCTANACLQDFELLSFTYPSGLQPIIDSQTTNWWEDFCKLFAEQKIWGKCRLDLSDVCLEHVLL